MSEENKPKSLEDHHRESKKKEEEKSKRMENVRQETIQRLKTDSGIQAYFQQFHPHGIESFISGYATWKSIFMEYGGVYENMAERYYTEYIERAEHCLIEIQLKKLFHLRCEWGANLIKIDGIDISTDFLVWSSDVLNCSFLSPISQDEFDLYLEYARSSQFEYNKYFSWFDIENTENGSRENIDYSGWFHYHNTHSDAGKYLLLPDIREQKERFYRQLHYKEQEQICEQKYASGEVPRPVIEKRPLLSQFNHDQLTEFIQRFENAETIRHFENYQHYGNPLTGDDDEYNNTYLDEQVQSIMLVLSTMKDVQLPVEANIDWRMALIDAFETFEHQQTVTHLPVAYNDYLFRIENKIQFPSDERKFNEDLAAIGRKQILRGRELNGEPADFNF